MRFDYKKPSILPGRALINLAGFSVCYVYRFVPQTRRFAARRLLRERYHPSALPPTLSPPGD